MTTTTMMMMTTGQPVGGNARILVVDGAADARLLARLALEHRRFDVLEAEDGERALALVRSGGIDLVVLEVKLPGMSGLAVLSRLRHEGDLPVIIVTDLRDETDRVIGLELGADDYMAKPFSPAELGARVTSVLRRSAGPGTRLAPLRHLAAEPAHVAGDVQVDQATRRVVVAGETVELSPKEFDLLACLASTPRRVFTRAELLKHVWDSAVDWQDPATVTEHVRRLRRKIEADPANPCRIQTVRGVGYRFDPGTRSSGAETALAAAS